MKIIIHDLEETISSQNKDDIIISNKLNIHHCIGCFGCWIKKPGQCIIKDDITFLGSKFAQADELIFITKCTYGGYSPFIKNVLERSISYLLPYFTIRQSEIHHKIRYQNTLDLTVHFYGDVTEQEKQTAKKLVRGNALNFGISDYSVDFYSSFEEAGGGYR